MQRLGRAAGVVLAVAALALVGVLVLTGCESPAAQRLRAEADLEYARASAYADKVAANEARRENGHQRALEVLPFVALFVAAGVIGLVAMLAGWDLLSRRQATGQADRALLLHLERLRLEQTQRDRELWRAIVALDRRELASGNGGEVVVYDVQGR